MLKIKLVSDLHLNHHKDGGDALLKSIPNDDHQVLVIAGDIADGSTLEGSLTKISNRFVDSQYFY